MEGLVVMVQGPLKAWRPREYGRQEIDCVGRMIRRALVLDF